MLLVVVDAHSKWPEVVCMTSTTSERTIEALREIFSRNGICCEQLVSDNAPQFTSDEFQAFMKINGITHLTGPVYHPSTNGLAENFVGTLKNALKSAQQDAGTLKKKLAQFLIIYRTTPHSTTNETPAQLLMGRKLRTKLDLLKPSVEERVHKNQFRAMITSNRTLREFVEGQAVAVRDYRGHDKWITATVVKRAGPLTYEVKTNNTATPAIWRHHVDQMRDIDTPATDSTPTVTATVENTTQRPGAAVPLPAAATVSASSTDQQPPTTEAPPSESDENSDTQDVNTEQNISETVSPVRYIASQGHVAERRYPCRDRKPPDRLIEHMND